MIRRRKERRENKNKVFWGGLVSQLIFFYFENVFCTILLQFTILMKNMPYFKSSKFYFLFIEIFSAPFEFSFIMLII